MFVLISWMIFLMTTPIKWLNKAFRVGSPTVSIIWKKLKLAHPIYIVTQLALKSSIIRMDHLQWKFFIFQNINNFVVIAYSKAEKNCHIFYLSVFQRFFSPILLLLFLLLFFMIWIDVGQFVGVTHTDKGWGKMKKCNKRKKLSII